MKKHLLFLLMAIALVACSKDDEPSGGGDNQDQNTEQPGTGGESNGINTYNGTFAETTTYFDGTEPEIIHTPAYDDWMSKYGKNFESKIRTEGMFVTETKSGSYDFYDCNFFEVDAIAAEFAGFTIDTPDSDEVFFVNMCSSMISGFLITPNNNLMSYGVSYSKLSDDFSNLSTEWEAIYSFHFENLKGESNYKLPKEMQEWAESHSANLTDSIVYDDGSISYEWTLNVVKYDEDYLQNEILPYLAMTNVLKYELTFVELHHKNDRIQRKFVGEKK